MEQFTNKGAMKGMPVDLSSKPIVVDVPKTEQRIKRTSDGKFTKGTKAPNGLRSIKETAIANGTTIQEYGRLGGLAGDPALKSVAARLQWLKVKGELNDEEAERLYKMMTDHKYAALDILETLKVMRDIAIKSNNVGQINLYTQRINDWNKIHFGEKIRVESTNVNVNINTTLEEWERRLCDDNNKVVEVSPK